MRSKVFGGELGCDLFYDLLGGELENVNFGSSDDLGTLGDF